MAGDTQALQVAPGVEIELVNFTPEENKRFDLDYPKVTAVYDQNSVRADQKHIIADWFDETIETYRLLAQACKHDIQPSAGMFQGQRATTGFGFRMIRPDDIVPTAQGRTFDATVAGLTANSWYGLYHNGAIGAAYNATALYLRKELGIGMVGTQEMGADSIIEETQFEINGKPLPVFNCERQFVGSGWRVFRFPQVEYFKPAIQYRSQAKFAAADGATKHVPVGLTFVTSDYDRNTTPTQPSTTAP